MSHNDWQSPLISDWLIVQVISRTIFSCLQSLKHAVTETGMSSPNVFLSFFHCYLSGISNTFLCVIEGSCANVSFNSELERLSWRIVCLYGVKRRVLRLQKKLHIQKWFFLDFLISFTRKWSSGPSCDVKKKKIDVMYKKIIIIFCWVKWSAVLFSRFIFVLELHITSHHISLKLMFVTDS